MRQFWGYHLMLDCSGCNQHISDKNKIKEFLVKLINSIGMVACGEPIIEYLSPTEFNSGYSVLQLISTSNVCAHFVENNNTAYFDIFSCKEFDTEVAKEIVSDFFNPSSIKVTFLTRQA